MSRCRRMAEIAYALLDDGSIAIYRLTDSGQFEAITGSPFPLGERASALALSPDGTRLYIANGGALDSSGLTPIRVFSVNPDTGELSWISDTAVTADSDGITSMAISADGAQLLISNFKTGGLAVFQLPALSAVTGVEALTEAHDPEMALEWMQTLYARVQADAVDAPAASRLYGYAGVTLYEAVVPGMPANRSLAGQLNDFPDVPIPNPGQVFDWPTSGAAALRVVLSGLMSAESGAEFSVLFERQLEERRAAVGSDAVIDASIGFGESVGADLLAWAQDDGYDETLTISASYEPPTGSPSLWTPTTEGRPPVEPYWGSLRPFALRSADECAVPMNAPYSEDEGSTFYLQALEVQAVEQALTPEQRAVAQWWVDTPGVTGAPSGHWMRIGGEIIQQLDMNLAQASELYAMLGMTLANSFISTWSLKYQVNLLRPVTYIQRFIDPRWQPYIESPSFPEYPSGHSVVSAAAADVLTSLYGAVAFTDHTHEDQSGAPRSFASFEAAATEAAFSRLFGGIHFRQAIENGLRQGRCITDHILGVVALRQFGQNE